MGVLLIVGFVGAVIVLYAADRARKARAQVRRLRSMSDRLEAAVTRADEQQEQRQAAAQASTALTSFMPAIKHPPLTVPGAPADGGARPARSARPGRRSSGQRVRRPR